MANSPFGKTKATLADEALLPWRVAGEEAGRGVWLWWARGKSSRTGIAALDQGKLLLGGVLAYFFKMEAVRKAPVVCLILWDSMGVAQIGNQRCCLGGQTSRVSTWTSRCIQIKLRGGAGVHTRDGGRRVGPSMGPPPPTIPKAANGCLEGWCLLELLWRCFVWGAGRGCTWASRVSSIRHEAMDDQCLRACCSGMGTLEAFGGK